MKKMMLRTLGLAAIVLLANLSPLKAAVGDCHIVCCDGTTWDGYAPSYSSCCDLFGSICGYRGGAYQETPHGDAYCLSISCED
jgi:hypothetical protein